MHKSHFMHHFPFQMKWPPHTPIFAVLHVKRLICKGLHPAQTKRNGLLEFVASKTPRAWRTRERVRRGNTLYVGL